MIRGRFVGPSPHRRAFVAGVFLFPSLGSARLPVPLLIDTGADRTVLSPAAASHLGDRLEGLPSGPTIGGVGGNVATRLIDAVLVLGATALPLVLTIPAAGRAGPAIPSILGRDVLSRYALVIEERTNRVLLLEPEESARLS